MSRGRILFGGAVVMSVLVGLMGCIPWFLRGEEASYPEATLPELLSRLEARTVGLSSLKALVAMKVAGGQPLTARLTWVRPHELHLRGFDPSGGTLFEVVVAGGLVRWSAPGRPPVLLGTVASLTQAASVETGPLPVAIVDLVRIASALTGPLFEANELPMLERLPGPFYLLHGVTMESEAARLTKRVWVDRLRFRPVRQEFFDPDGSVVLVIAFSDYRLTTQGEWPHQVVAQSKTLGTSVEWVFREIRFNVPIPMEEFRLTGGPFP